MTRRQGRPRRSNQEGVTLIELLVTIAVMTIGFLAIIAGFSTVEKQVGSTGDDAQLTALARLVGTTIEAEPAQGGLSYVECATTGTSYQTAVTKDTTIAAAEGTNTVTITAVAQSTGGTHVVSSSTVALTPISTCTGTPDYGVQRITFTVSSTLGNSVTRTVYKRWN